MEEIINALALRNELDALRPIDKEQEAIIMQKFRLDWNYHSNHLEGNSLNYGETKALILFGITAQGKPLKDHFEMTGHNEAIDWVLEMLSGERPLTESFIRELHKLLLKESSEKAALTPEGNPTTKKINVGSYKTTPNHVKTATGEIFRFATPEETPALMTDLLHWYNEKLKEKEINPIFLATEFHYKFIRIHPFDDGNGRTARILMNFILMQFGFPPVIIKTEDKENYFAVLQIADAGDIEPFIFYIAKNLVRSLEIMISGAKGERVEEPDDLDKEIALLERKLKNIGKVIEIKKSNASALEILNGGISLLLNKLAEKFEKFDKYYLNKGISIVIDNQPKDFVKGINFYNSGDTVINSLKIVINYNTIVIEGFEDFRFYSELEVLFGNLFYTVSDRNKEIFEMTKYYNEQLTDEEIQNIVKTIVKKHNELIDTKITNKKFR